MYFVTTVQRLQPYGVTPGWQPWERRRTGRSSFWIRWSRLSYPFTSLRWPASVPYNPPPNQRSGSTLLIHITEIVDITDEVVAAFSRLIPQLSSSSPPPGPDELSEMAANPNTVLLGARDSENGTLVGTLTLAFFRIPTGLQARIEDVVVDEARRGKGIGRDLTNAAIDRARAAGAKAVGLTSRPGREAANALYSSMGFERRETNVYRLKL